MLVFFAWPFVFPGLAYHKFGEIAIAYILGGPLREEVDIVLVVFELFFFLQFLFFFFVFDAQLLIVAIAPLVGVDIFVVLFDPSEGLFFGHADSLVLVTLHHY